MKPFIKVFLPTRVWSHVTDTLCIILVKIWPKESQGFKSHILLLMYQYVFINIFFRKSVIEIWEVNHWRTDSSINGSWERAFTEIIGYFCNIGKKKEKMSDKIWLKISLDLYVDSNHSYNFNFN